MVEERAWRWSTGSILRRVSMCTIRINELSAFDRAADLVLLLLLVLSVDKDSRPEMHEGTVPVVNSTDYKKRKAKGDVCHSFVRLLLYPSSARVFIFAD